MILTDQDNLYIPSVLYERRVLRLMYVLFYVHLGTYFVATILVVTGNGTWSQNHYF